jgi:hypothetical protein
MKSLIILELALANREKLPLPTMNMSQTTKADGDVYKSKSLPTNIEKVLGSGDEQNSLTEATGMKHVFPLVKLNGQTLCQTLLLLSFLLFFVVVD